MWWLLACVISLTSADINSKSEDNRTTVQMSDMCKYEDGGRIMNCTDLPLLRFGPDIVRENVEIVYVKECYVTSIPENTFQDTRQLRHLDASHNLMRTLNPRVFRSTAQLSHLDISNNLINTLDNRTFLGLNKLSHLDLNDNLLNMLDYGTFKDTNTLSYLDLSYNKLDILDYRLLQSTTKLSHLNLSNNLLSILDYRIFNTANILSHLNVSHNSLEVLDYRTFISTTGLSHLDLSSNSIEILEQLLFNSLKSLQYLNLKNNRLASIQNSFLFTSQGQLTTLLLGHNNISTVDVNVFKPLKSIKELDLSANPLICNCGLYLLMMWYTSKNLTTNVTCGNTVQLNDMPWNSTNSSEICPEVVNEEDSTEIIVGISVACLLLCVITCLSIFLWKRTRKTRPVVDEVGRSKGREVDNSQMNSFVYDDVEDNHYETIGVGNVLSSGYLTIINPETNPKQHDYATGEVGPSNTFYSYSYIQPDKIKTLK